MYFITHCEHIDPICFTATIFCNFLPHVCLYSKKVINVNLYDKAKPKFHLLMAI